MTSSVIHTCSPSEISILGCVFSEIHGSSSCYWAVLFSLEWAYEANLSWVNTTVESCSGCCFLSCFFF
jgi:hypothetical protein